MLWDLKTRREVDQVQDLMLSLIGQNADFDIAPFAVVEPDEVLDVSDPIWHSSLSSNQVALNMALPASRNGCSTVTHAASKRTCSSPSSSLMLTGET